MTDDSVSRFLNFTGLIWMVKKNTEWFLGSNLQCCLHATVIMAVKYSVELNKYILLVRVICKKYRFRGQEKFHLDRYFSQITLTNRIYLYNVPSDKVAILGFGHRRYVCIYRPRFVFVLTDAANELLFFIGWLK